MLTDFHTYDTLAESGRSTRQVATTIQQLARKALA
jgi:hypothetical protein